MNPADLELLIDAARSGDRRATGRLISTVENDIEAGTGVLRSVHDAAISAWITGLTGAPGAGKSTLADLLIAAWRAAGKKVAVLAVDPTSPFTGGALLGDRVRMQTSSGDDAVLVRSMATRGWLGGLARATQRVAALCAGLGYDEILIETVGVGQSEVDVAAAADTTAVVVTPGWGDGVQVAKAGVMEIGDVFVVNKADRDGASDAVKELSEMLKLVEDAPWHPPVVSTVATAGDGIDDLVAALDSHRQHRGRDGAARLARRRQDFRRAVIDLLGQTAQRSLDSTRGREIAATVESGDVDPWTAAADLLEGG